MKAYTFWRLMAAGLSKTGVSGSQCVCLPVLTSRVLALRPPLERQREREREGERERERGAERAKLNLKQ